VQAQPPLVQALDMAKILLVKDDWRFAEGSVRRNEETMYPTADGISAASAAGISPSLL